MNIQLDSAEKLKANWSFIISEGLLPQLIADGIVAIAFEAAINAGVLWRVYNGRVDMRAVYRAFGEPVGEAAAYKTYEMTPDLAFAVAGLIISHDPRIVADLIAMNGGTMPEILPPVVPLPPAPPAEEPEPDEPPVDEPAPDPEAPEPTEEQPPVDPPASETDPD